MILKIIIIINALMIISLFKIRKYLDSVESEKAIKTYKQMDELIKIYENVNTAIILGIVNLTLPIMMWLININKILYGIDIILFLIILLYFLYSILNVICIKNAINETKINEVKRENANKDMRERFK